jgi:hypothetical protein
VILSAIAENSLCDENNIVKDLFSVRMLFSTIVENEDSAEVRIARVTVRTQ